MKWSAWFSRWFRIGSNNSRCLVCDDSDLFAPESLERRAMLAGNVTAIMTNAGDLRITGDNLDNQIRISLAPNGDIMVAGAPGTSVNNGSYAAFTTNGIVADDLFITMRGGNDIVEMKDIQVNDDTRINMGSGNDLFGIKDNNFIDDVSISMAAGNDFVTLVDNTIGNIGTNDGNLRITTAGGNDLVHISHCGTVGGITTIVTGGGEDILFAAGGLSDRLNISLGGASDLAMFGTMMSVNNAKINLGGGLDAVLVTTTAQLHGGRISGGGGATDAIRVAPLTFLGTDLISIEDQEFNHPDVNQGVVDMVLVMHNIYQSTGGSLFYLNC